MTRTRWIIVLASALALLATGCGGGISSTEKQTEAAWLEQRAAWLSDFNETGPQAFSKAAAEDFSAESLLPSMLVMRTCITVLEVTVGPPPTERAIPIWDDTLAGCHHFAAAAGYIEDAIDLRRSGVDRRGCPRVGASYAKNRRGDHEDWSVVVSRENAAARGFKARAAARSGADALPSSLRDGKR